MINAISKSVLAIALGLAASVAALPVSAQSDIRVESQMVSHYVVRKGTREFDQVRQFIARGSAHEKRDSGATRNLNPDDLGDFYITVTRSVSGATNSLATAAVEPPPAPWLPPSVGAHIGDTATVSSCGGGTEQTWTVEYEQTGPNSQGWVTVKYTFARKQQCTPGGV